MEIVLQYFEGCPHWQRLDRDLATLVSEGLVTRVDHDVIDSQETAVRKGFPGSPTVLIDGVDPFRTRTTPAGLGCRLYDTDHGPAGSPTLEWLRSVIRERTEES